MNNNHYYQENQDNIASNPSSFDYVFKDVHFKFNTDAGVFSKDYLDYGSQVLLKSFIPNKIGGPILDMGAGYGPIGIIISKIYDQEVHMCEINSRAYDLLKKNIEFNKVKAIPYHSNLFEQLPPNIKFASVVTNPPIRAGKSVVFSIYQGAYDRLVLGGELWVVIQKKQGAPSSKAFIESLFNNCEIVNRDKGYYILKAIK